MSNIILSIFCLLFVYSYSAQQNDVVMTKFGKIRGLVFPTFRRFQGVPYATPPLGKLRWKKPIDPTPWKRTIDCREFEIGCAQSAHSLDVPKNTSEDCLYLEVWTPPVGKYTEPAAVMVFFYGGDFKQGGESFKVYDGAQIASTTNTILVVTNYRVGNLGFLLTEWSDPNVGIEDQRFTLRWVKQNIAYFGGDPNRVLIFGESAGGESVLIHLSSPQTSGGLFNAVISESGPMSLNFKTQREATILSEVFAYHLGCLFGDWNCYLNKTTKEVLVAADKSFLIPSDISEAVMQWCPVVVGTSLPQQPVEAFQSGQIIKVPMAIGSNLNDGVLFGYALSKTSMYSPEYIAIVEGIFIGTNYVTEILVRYPPVFLGDNRAILSKLITDYLFGCSARKTLRWAENAGVKNTYLFQFSRSLPFCLWPKSQEFCCDKVCHGDELPYVFTDSNGAGKGPFPWNLTGYDLLLSEVMSLKWASMAKYGDPNVYPSNYTWPVYRSATNMSMNFGNTLNPVQNLDSALCDFWDQVGYLHSTRTFMKQARAVLEKVRNVEKNKKEFILHKKKV